MSASKPPKRATASATPGRPRRPSSSLAAAATAKAGRKPSLNEIILEEAARIAKVKVGEKVLHTSGPSR